MKERVKDGSPKKATITDLVEATGLSLGTVSRVLNNRSNVAQKTREKVLRVAREMNLKPQGAARSRQVAILSDPHSPDRLEGYTATLTAHFAYLLTRRGIGVAFPSDPEEELPKMFLDGVIAINCVSDVTLLLSELESRIPVVYMDKFDPAPHQYCVCSDHYAAGRIAAEHFLSRGKSRLSFYAQNSLPHQERLRGFRAVMDEQGMDMDPDRIVLSDATSNMAMLARIVRSGADALYVPGSSYQVIDCLHALTYLMRVKVPEDISIIGGENEGLSELMNPPLSTIEEPLHDMAEQAIAVLEELLDGRNPEKRSYHLPVRLIERNSVKNG